jgi:hypothetical protein
MKRHKQISNDRNVYVFSKLAPAKPTIVYDTYWRFAAERQEIFFKRFSGLNYPWTNDSILMTYKFTNAYRACDRVSQYLIRNVIYGGEDNPEELFFRILIFKTFNRIDTWELLKETLGAIRYEDYSFQRYDAVLSKALARGSKIYSAAYIMPSGGKGSRYAKKHQMNLQLVTRMIEDRVPQQLAEMKSMRDAFELLLSYPTIGDFLGYQYVTDLNYSTLTSFTEMEFVTPGPGAIDGIHKCFSDLGGLNETEIIKLVAERQDMEFERLGISFRSLWGRPLQLIDCQNVFCEVSKYARLRHPHIIGKSKRTRIKQLFRPNDGRLEYFFPPKWRIKVSANQPTVSCHSKT